MSAPAWIDAVADHKQRQALHIGRTAVELTLQHGLPAVSMRGLAEAAGVARATLYNYFPDVATAIRHYFTAQSAAFDQQLRAAIAEETTPQAKLRRYLTEQLRYVSGDEHQAAAAIMESGALPPPASHTGAHRTRRRRPDVLSDILTAGVQTGAFRLDLNVPVTAALIGQMLYATHDLIHRRRHATTDVLAAVTRLVEAGVESPATPPKH